MNDITPSSRTRSTDERAMIARWVAVWQQAGSELEARRRARLVRMTTSEARRCIKAIFASQPPIPPRESSGLVEQQRLLSRLK